MVFALCCHLLVLNICMTFYEYTLFKSYRADMILSRSWYLKVQRDVIQKVSVQELWFLRSACGLMLVNISMKFHEDVLNGFKVIERTRFCHRYCYIQSSKGHYSKKYISKSYDSCALRVIQCWLIFIYSFMKISWTVFKLQSGHDFVTDRQMDSPGKNNMSPNPKGGRHK